MASYFQTLLALFALVSFGFTASVSRIKRQAGGFTGGTPGGGALNGRDLGGNGGTEATVGGGGLVDSNSGTGGLINVGGPRDGSGVTGGNGNGDTPDVSYVGGTPGGTGDSVVPVDGNGADGGLNINYLCPTSRGLFPFPGDCSKFVQCDGGVATVGDCQPQLIFNEVEAYCDWPYRVPNPNCQSSVPKGILRQNLRGLCDGSVNAGGRFGLQVPHPEFCNAFYMCSSTYLVAPCNFCPENMYFDQAASGCLDLIATGRNVTSVCGNKQFISHAEKVFRQLDGSCWPYENIENPWHETADVLNIRTILGLSYTGAPLNGQGGPGGQGSPIGSGGPSGLGSPGGPDGLSGPGGLGDPSNQG